MKSLILHNDDTNTIQHVIISLVNYCKISPEQAEKYAMTAHTLGKCKIESDNIKDIEELQVVLNENNIQTSVE